MNKTRPTSIFTDDRGDYWHVRSKKWVAYITHNKKCIHLGIFENELDAAVAYRKAALSYHGDFACSEALYAPNF